MPTWHQGLFVDFGDWRTYKRGPPPTRINELKKTRAEAMANLDAGESIGHQ